MRTSLLIFAYNHERFAGECLSALERLDPLPGEIIITDDCSQDRTQEVIREFVERWERPCPIRTSLNSENIGLIPQVNKLVQMAKGDVIFITSADDILEPEFVSVASQAFEDEEVFGLLVNPIVIDDKGESLGRLTEMDGDEFIGWGLLFKEGQAFTFYHCGFRRVVFETFGALEAGSSEDVEFIFRECLLGQILWLDRSIVRYRRHEANMSHWGNVLTSEENQWRKSAAAAYRRNRASMTGLLHAILIFRNCFPERAEDTERIYHSCMKRRANSDFMVSLLEKDRISLRDVLFYLKWRRDFKSLSKGILALISPRICRDLVHRRLARKAQTYYPITAIDRSS